MQVELKEPKSIQAHQAVGAKDVIDSQSGEIIGRWIMLTGYGILLSNIVDERFTKKQSFKSWEEAEASLTGIE